MSMFDNYENLNSDYIPNNSKDPEFTDYIQTNNTLPKCLYNAKGEYIGISWKQGEDVTIPITVDNSLLVETGSIILTISGQTPQTSLSEEQIATVVRGTRCYNTADAKSWTCTSLDTITRVWKQDKVLTTPSVGTSQVFKNQEFIDSSSINFEVNLYNFRYEKALDTIVPNSTGRSFNLNVSAETSAKLLPGLYKLVAAASQGAVNRIVYEQFILVCQGD